MAARSCENEAEAEAGEGKSTLEPKYDDRSDPLGLAGVRIHGMVYALRSLARVPIEPPELMDEGASASYVYAARGGGMTIGQTEPLDDGANNDARGGEMVMATGVARALPFPWLLKTSSGMPMTPTGTSLRRSWTPFASTPISSTDGVRESETSLAEGPGLIVRLGVSQPIVESLSEFSDALDEARERCSEVVRGGVGGFVVGIDAILAREAMRMALLRLPVLMLPPLLVAEAVLARDSERDCMGGAATPSRDFDRDATLSVEAFERRRCSRADTGRMTPSAFKLRREKRGAEAWDSQFSSGLREVEGPVRGGMGDPVRGSS